VFPLVNGTAGGLRCYEQSREGGEKKKGGKGDCLFSVGKGLTAVFRRKRGEKEIVTIFA